MSTRMSGGQAAIEALKVEGVSHVFGLIGSATTLSSTFESAISRSTRAKSVTLVEEGCCPCGPGCVCLSTLVPCHVHRV